MKVYTGLDVLTRDKALQNKFKGIFSFSSDYSSLDKNSNIFDLSSNEDQDVNLSVDLYHFGNKN
jgi:hypothetical protein